MTEVASPPNGDVLTGAPPARPPKKQRTRLRVLVVLGLVGAAFVFLLAKGLGSSLNYFDTVDEAATSRASIGTGNIRLEGVVVPGSIRGTTDGSLFNLVGTNASPVYQIHNIGSPPALFQDNIPVVVVGHFMSATSPVFISDQIMVKHGSNYIAEHPGRVRAPNGSSR